MLRVIRSLLVFGVSFAPLSLLRAQASPTVDPLARVNDDIERLAALGFIDRAIMGQRPFSAREIVRLLENANAHIRANSASGDTANDRATHWAARVVAADLARYAPRPSDVPRWYDYLKTEESYLSSPARQAPSDENGSIDARLNPLAAYRGGRPLANGTTALLESHHSFVPDPHLALWVSPIASATQQHGTSATTLALQSGGARTEFGNLAVELARDYEVFGQSPQAATVLSTNAPALDALTITNDHPASLPFLAWLGPVKGTVFVADLGKSQNFPHARLAAWKVSILPHSNVELGASLESQTGGNGGPAGSFGDRVVDLFPIINGLRNFLHNGSGNTNFSNKFFGLDARWRIPQFYGLDLYVDGAVDDFDTRRLRSSLFSDGGVVGGFTLNCLIDCGRLRVRAEYQQTGIRYYTHTQFTSGYTSNGNLLGDALGPRGVGGYASAEVEMTRGGTLRVDGAYEVRSGNRYSSSSPLPNDRAFHFVMIEHRPGEHRSRASLSWNPEPREARASSRLTVGLERVANYAFVAGSDRINALAQIAIELRP